MGSSSDPIKVEGQIWKTVGNWIELNSYPMGPDDVFKVNYTDLSYIRSQVEGKLLTLIEAVLPDKIQLEATKSLARNVIAESFNRLMMVQIKKE